MQRKREHLWVGLGLCALAVGGFLLLVMAKRTDARHRVEVERRALRHLHALAAAQHAFHERRGRYGRAAELRDAELIDGAVEADGSIVAGGYRFEILLPHGLSPREFVQMAPESAGMTNPRLEAKHFAVVARPLGTAPHGRRSYCVDETKQLYVNEGVAEVAGGRPPPPPALHLSHSKLLDVGGRRWWRSEDVDPKTEGAWR